jgi:hypothetical protein
MATDAPSRPGALIDDSSSDDEAPLAARVPTVAAPKPSAPPAAQNDSSAPGPSHPAPVAKPPALKKEDSNSEDDVPLAARQKAVVPQPAAAPKPKAVLDDAEELLPAPKPKPKPAPKPVAKPADSSDSEDDVPLAQRRISTAAPGK